MKILIGGDFCPENRAEQQLIKGENLLDEAYENIWSKPDYRVLNLEGPITNTDEKILKVGRHIKFSPDIEMGLQKMNIDVLSLANNHIMDFGNMGYRETISTLDKIGIDYIGCSSKKYTILEKANVKVALLSFSNKEFSLIADFQGEGAYPIDLIDILQTIELVKKETTNIIILLHTGLSKFPYPSPEQKKLCRFLIEQGATSVLCQHSHTIGAFEYYKDGFISYGQGSFVFDLIRRDSTWNKGYSILFNFNQKNTNVEVIPHKQFDDYPLVRSLTKNETKLFTDEIHEYNTVLQNENLLNEKWIKYLETNKKYYYNQFFLPKSRVIRKILNKISFDRFVNTVLKLLFLNNFRNDEHREVMINLLKNR